MGPSSPGCRRPQPTASRRFPLPASSRCEDLCVVWRSDLREMARQRADAMVDRLAELVSCESPSGVLHALERCADLLIAWGDDAVGRPAERVERDGMPHLRWRAPDPTVLVLGHFDTVWPLGTVADWPMTVRDGVASGPGVFDMKAGIVQGLAAFELVADRSKVNFLLTCDEEIGSITSRSLIEEEARQVKAVLVCEPSADSGAARHDHPVPRDTLAGYRVVVMGRAAHAGLEPELGVNAGIELALQVLAVQPR